jgi:trk system potassium uptake protein TrkA
MKVIIIGCGRTGALLACNLSDQGHAVAIIDSDPEAFLRLGDCFKGRTLVGLGYDKDVLERAGIAEAEAVAAVTSVDETNLLVAQIARKLYNVPRVASRVFEPERAVLYEKLGVSVISSVSWRVRRLEQIICHSTINVRNTLGNGGVLQIDLAIPPELAGYAVEQLSRPGRWLPSTVIRNGAAYVVSPELELESGDILHVSVAADALNELKAWIAEQDTEVEACGL